MFTSCFRQSHTTLQLVFQKLTTWFLLRTILYSPLHPQTLFRFSPLASCSLVLLCLSLIRCLQLPHFVSGAATCSVVEGLQDTLFSIGSKTHEQGTVHVSNVFSHRYLTSQTVPEHLMAFLLDGSAR